MAFIDPDEAKPASSTGGGFIDPDEVKKPVESKGGAAFGVYPRPGMEPGKPTPTTSALGAFGASAAEAVATTPGVMAGARLGSAVMPPVAPIVGPLAKPIGGLVGGVLGGITAGELLKTTEKFADTVFGTNISGVREAQQQEHPYASLAGQVAGGGVNPWMRPGLAGTVKEGVVNSGLMTIVGATQRAIQGGDPFDPLALTVDATMGAATKPTKMGERLMGQGAPVKPEVKPADTSNIPNKPVEATPEQKQAYIQKLESIKAERDSKAQLVEAAIRNKTTGELERMGPKHDQARKDDIRGNPNYEEGFIDERGNFHERTAAVDQAKRSGQIPEDHVLENPPGETPGLHSGDLRKVGDERFAVTENQPAGVAKTKPPETKNNVIKLKDSSRPLTDSEINEKLKTKEGRLWLAENTNFISPELSAVFKSPTDFTARRNLELITEKQNQLYSLYDRYGGSEENILRSKDAEQFVKLKEEYETLKNKIEQSDKPTSSSDELAKSTTESVAKASEKVDVKSIPNEEEFYKHATDMYERYGEEEAIKFFEEYQQNLNERSIPVPNNNEQLDDMLHKMNTFETKDSSEHVIGYENNTKNGVTPEQRAQWFDMRERGEELPPEAKAILDELDAENIALVRKAKGMGLEVGDEFATGQSRTRLFSPGEKPGWAETVKKFFSNDTPMGDKVAEQANAAIKRKVFGLETWTTDPKVKGAAVKKETGRVIEMHRHPEDTTYSYQDGSGKWQTVPVKKGTSIWEWKDGKKKQIGHSEKLDLKRGDTLELKVSGETPVGADGTSVSRVIKSQAVISDGKVMDIERHSPYRYLHDAEASARLANMGLRKMVREAEAVENLKKSELFKQVGYGPDQPNNKIPPGWIQPENIDRIPQLRGWAFDPKTAAIISDFAKVWDNTMWTKLSNALVKNMMLNPVPHMFNEVMHLWNARGFTGWVMPNKLGTFADTARQAWRDVGQQTQFYRDIMREGGSILGADPRNKGYFDTIVKEASKEMFGTEEMKRSMGQLAKRLGTNVGDLYNGIAQSSQKAMWFTRDVMYVQYVREIMANHEKATGSKLELADAIKEAERHMPNYRMPSEIAGSRSVSKYLKNPNIFVFSRYHYGMVKSLVNTLKDIDPRNLRTPEGRKHFREGIDSMVAIGVAMGVLYPLMDSIAEAMFGEGAEQRRAGPYHLIQAGMDVVEGKKDASALIWPIATFNPVLLSLGQLALNKKIFTGKEIYHPDDSLSDIAGDIGSYALKQVPQSSPILDATADEEGQSKLIARQLDIKAKTEKEKEREARAKKYQERTKKGRDTKRAKGTYNP